MEADIFLTILLVMVPPFQSVHLCVVKIYRNIQEAYFMLDFFQPKSNCRNYPFHRKTEHDVGNVSTAVQTRWDIWVGLGDMA